MNSIKYIQLWFILFLFASPALAYELTEAETSGLTRHAIAVISTNPDKYPYDSYNEAFDEHVGAYWGEYATYKKTYPFTSKMIVDLGVFNDLGSHANSRFMTFFPSQHFGTLKLNFMDAQGNVVHQFKFDKSGNFDSGYLSFDGANYSRVTRNHTVVPSWVSQGFCNIYGYLVVEDGVLNYHGELDVDGNGFNSTSWSMANFSSITQVEVEISAIAMPENDSFSRLPLVIFYKNIADFSASPTSGEPPLIVNFSDQSSSEVSITSWQWDFDNDGIIDSTAENPEFTYIENGAYSVSLTVSDGTENYAITKSRFVLAYESVPLDQATTGTIQQASDNIYYKIELDPGQSSLLILDDHDNLGTTRMYLKKDSVPTAQDYDYAATVDSADQELLLPIASAGEWFLAVEGIDASGDYTLTAELIQVGLDHISPVSQGQTDDTAITLTGFGFDPDTTVALIDATGTEYAPTSFEIDTITQITAHYNTNNLTPGLYDVRISNQYGVDTMPQAFELQEGGEAKLETRLVLPGALGRHAVATLWVEYENTGTLSMPSPLLVVKSADEDDSDKPILTMDASRIAQNLWTSTMPQGTSHSVQFLADGDDDSPGVLEAGEKGRVPVYYVGLLQPWNFSDSSVEFEVRVIDGDNPAPLDWDSREAWDSVYPNFSDSIGLTWGDYLNVVSKIQLVLHPKNTLSGDDDREVTSLDSLFEFAVEHSSRLTPIQTLASAVDIEVDVPGLGLSFARSIPSVLPDRLFKGRLGTGWHHSWFKEIVEQDNGDVLLMSNGSPRLYQPDSRGGYISPAGDFDSSLEKLSDGFLLAYRDGSEERYDAQGRFLYLQDPNGNRITASYSGDQLDRLTHSSGQWLAFTYQDGLLATISDHTSQRTVNYSYNANGQLATVVDAQGFITRYSYYTSGEAKYALKTITHPSGVVEGFAYDTNGRLQSLSTNDEITATLDYSKIGEVKLISAADNATETFYYGPNGELVKYKDPLGYIVQNQYDAEGLLKKTVRPDGLAGTLGYDSQGNPNTAVDPLNQKTRFSFGERGEMESITDARGKTSDYAYDAQGNLESITYPDETIESADFDAYGNLILTTNRRGHTITYSYDSAGRLDRKTYPDATFVDFDYDLFGNLTRMEDATGITTYSYYPNSLLKRVTYPGDRWLEFTYDSAGRRTSSTDQLGHVLRYSYNAKGLLEHMTEQDAGQPEKDLVHYDYDAQNRVSKKTLGNGVYTVYQYDLADQLDVLTNYASDGSILSFFDYEYDNLGRRTDMKTADGDWSYGYDATGQLTSAVFASTNPEIPGKELAWTYDEVGNRKTETEDGVTTVYTTNEMNQYTQVGDVIYEYDDDGNLISKTDGEEIWTYEYDYDGRLRGFVSSFSSVEYIYNGVGDLSSSNVNGLYKAYANDPIGYGNIVGEYNASGSIVARYSYSIELIAKNKAMYLSDGNGNIIQVINSSSSTVNQYCYAPFGNAIYRLEADENSLQFSGLLGAIMFPEGHVHMRNRVYIDDIGRFSSEDPIGFLGLDVNLHRYAGNNPISLVDPDGLKGVPRITSYDVETLGGAAKGGLDELAKGGNAADIAYGIASGFAGAVLGTPWTLLENSPDIANSLKNIRDRKISEDKAIHNMGGVPDNFGYRKPAMGDAWFQQNPDSLCFLRRWLAKPENWCDRDKPSSPTGEKGADGTGDQVAAVDPNELTAPGGYGPANHIASGTLLPYRIDFENFEDATAPAQMVEITNQLAEAHDWSTVQITEIGFGDVVVTVPTADAQSFETRVPMRYNGIDFEVEILADIDTETGLITARFFSYLPDSELPPAVDIGFLPPEDGTGRGMGYVNYTVNHANGLADNTEIRNIARIVFDMGEVIYTNQVDPRDPSQGTDPTKEALVTIDAYVPHSAVEPLLAEMPATIFEVTWIGTDSASGVATYDVYSREGEDGPWTLWLDNTNATSAWFTGERSKDYAFYTIATDNVGLVEQKHPTVEARTTVSATAIEGTTLCTSQSEIPLEQCETLVSFYESTGGPDWTDSPGNGWLQNTSPCSWDGVTCSLGNVTKIVRVQKGMSGTIPDISALIELEDLTLPANDLTGSLPPLHELVNLRILALHQNRFNGPLPTLSNLPNLYQVFLRDNEFGGQIPPFSGLNELVAIDLSANDLSGAIPELQGLPKLKQLVLHNNNLDGAIPSLSGLTGIEGIQLQGNNLTGSIPSFSHLENLGGINLSNNQFSGSIPTLEGLPNLTSIQLAYNQLEGDIPVLSGLASIKSIFLHDNKLEGAIPDISMLINLESLLISGNRLAGEIPHLEASSALKYLVVDRNKLHGTVPTLPASIIGVKLGYNSFSANAGALVETIAPDWRNTQTVAPNEIYAAALSSTTIALDWTPIAFTSYEGNYTVEYALSESGPWNLVGTTENKLVSSFFVDNLTPGTGYWFRVKTTTLSHRLNQNEIVSEPSEPVFARTQIEPVAPSITLSQELVAHYPFNGNADDISGKDNHGTLYGPMLDSDRFGNPGSAYYFDGIDDFIDVGNGIKPELPATFSMWVYPEGYDIYVDLFETDDLSSELYHGILLRLSADGSVAIQFGDGGSAGPWSRSSYGGGHVPLNQWTHLAFVIRGRTDMSVYINGIAIDGLYGNGYGGSLSYSTNPGYIGKNSMLDDFYEGIIDDIMVYDRELSPAEIQMLATFDPDADPDQDGLSNFAELELKTNPMAFDTDGDSLGDGGEFFDFGTDPLNSDSDNDGIPDGWEIDAGTDPFSPEHSQCVGLHAQLPNRTYYSGEHYYCRTDGSIETTSPANIVLESGAQIELMAPVIQLRDGFRAEQGSRFRSTGVQ